MNSSLDTNLAAGRAAQSAKGAGDSPDQSLLRSVAAGDEDAFGELYHRHSGGIYNYLVRLTNDEHVSEELLQETFVVVWQGANKFQRRAKVKTWIFRIAHNLAVSWLRRNRPLLMEESRLPSENDNESPEVKLMASWRSGQLTRALQALSPTHQAVLELVFVQELPYADIAQIMECPTGTVKSRVSYALRHLNRLLSKTDIEE